MGLIDQIFGGADQTQALGLLGAGLMAGNAPGGFRAAQGLLAEAPRRRMQEQLLQAQIAETQAQAQARAAQAQQQQAELERQARIRQGMGGLFQQPGMTGGEAVPQEVGGVPMFSKPMGAAPMQAKPGGFDVQQAIALGMSPKEIADAAALANIGRSKVARTVKGMGPDNKEYEYQVDEYGQRVGDPFAQYRAPLQVGQGDRTTFADPYSLQPVGSFQMNQSPDSKASNALGWANNALTRRGQDMTDARARETNAAGKAPPGYRYKEDGSLEAIPGGPADIKAGEAGEKAAMRTATAEASVANVRGAIADAKKLVGYTTAGVGGVLSNIPATDARNLQAKLQMIKANLGFDRLQQMRAESPTGGALGQVAVQELVALQSTVASLDQMQSPTELNKALDKIDGHYNRWLSVVQQSKGGGTGGASGGWSIQKVN